MNWLQVYVQDTCNVIIVLLLRVAPLHMKCTVWILCIHTCNNIHFCRSHAVAKTTTLAGRVGNHFKIARVSFAENM